MPQIGEIKRASDLGYVGGSLRMWSACLTCGKGRWTLMKKGVSRSPRCLSCARRLQRPKNWKGGSLRSDGYIEIRLLRDDFFFRMCGPSGKILSHRLVMAKYLNRCLLPWEIVHHKNGIRNDNRIENLELIGCNGRHNTQLHAQLKKQQQEIDILQAKVANLENELLELKLGGKR